MGSTTWLTRRLIALNCAAPLAALAIGPTCLAAAPAAPASSTLAGTVSVGRSARPVALRPEAIALRNERFLALVRGASPTQAGPTIATGLATLGISSSSPRRAGAGATAWDDFTGAPWMPAWTLMRKSSTKAEFDLKSPTSSSASGAANAGGYRFGSLANQNSAAADAALPGRPGQARLWNNSADALGAAALDAAATRPALMGIAPTMDSLQLLPTSLADPQPIAGAAVLPTTR
jgi:hypothetical protein